MICTLILAAGMSSRMKAFKPLLPLKGKTVIECTIDSALSGGSDRAVLVTGHRSDELSALVQRKYSSSVITVKNEKYRESDMLCSVKAGLSAMPECDAFFILPGDMPVVRNTTFRSLISAYKDGGRKIIFPTLSGYRKHPPLVDSSFIPDIMSYTGKGGLRSVWKKYENCIIEIPVDDEGVWIDLDTPSDYMDINKKFKG